MSEKEKKELIKTLVSTKEELEMAHINYEAATGGLIDYYAYQIKSIYAKYDYLMQIVKKEGIVQDVLSLIKTIRTIDETAI